MMQQLYIFTLTEYFQRAQFRKRCKMHTRSIPYGTKDAVDVDKSADLAL